MLWSGVVGFSKVFCGCIKKLTETSLNGLTALNDRGLIDQGNL
jgi:hypothetical protein